MSNTSQPNSELASHLDLDLAIERVYRNIGSGCFPNRLDAAMIKNFKIDVKTRVTELLNDLKMDWANGTARYFDLPKQDGLVRPICYLDVEVAVAYQALVDAATASLEPYISEKFDDRILSHRLRSPNSEVMFQRPSESYRRYLDIQNEQSKSREYSHCLKLDISNYYERIYHHKLQQLLERRGVPSAVTTAICRLLRKFANGDSHGIPQGLWASDYLGNTYLLYLDEFLDDKGNLAIRYVDDYRIFCSSEAEARSILKECAGMLRELGLNLQPQKTSIITVDKVHPELKPITERFLDLQSNTVFLQRFDLAYFEADLWEEVEGAAPLTDDVVRDFERLWTEGIDQEDKRASILSFALSGLSAGASPTAEGHILENLALFPNMASASIKYLKSFGFKDKTAGILLDFVESRECIHEWQQMWILEYFSAPDADIGHYKSRLKNIMSNSNSHPLVRALISELIAHKGSDTDGEDVKRLFYSETDHRLRRHLLLGFRLLPVTERNRGISYLPSSEWGLGLVGKLVKSQVQLAGFN